MSKRPTISLRTKYEVLLRQSVCFYCRNPFAPAAEEAVEYDHVHARALGGSDDKRNLVASCKACHREKTNVDIKKISFERRRDEKRKRAAEKRALEKLTKREDLLKLVIRGSDLKVEVKDDELGDVGEQAGDGSRSKYVQKARPKTKWPKRAFGRRPAGKSRRAESLGGNQDREADGEN